MKKLLVICAVLFALPCIALASPVPDTGQSKCYNNTQKITCPNPGEDFYGQDGNCSINPLSYTKLDASGNDLPDAALWPWAMVRDNVTGLIWEVKQDKDDVQNYNNPHDADNTYILYDYSNKEPSCGRTIWQFVNDINTKQFGGFSDWRIPTIQELMSLVDRDRYDPAINTTYFPNTKSCCYWSSTAYDDSFAWGVCFGEGVMKHSDDYCQIGCVRAVRTGGQGITTTTTNGNTTSTTTSERISPCIQEVIYGEHSEETELLRYFRDNILNKTPEGQELIKLYYLWSPTIVKAMEGDEYFKEAVKELIDGVLPMLENVME